MTRALCALAALLLTAGALVCCSTGPEPEQDQRRTTTLAEPTDVVDEPLMLALAQAKNLHHKADVHLQDVDIDAAISAVRDILSVPFPEGAPEGEEVLLDARARLAKLLVTRGELDEAMNVVEEGLAGASRESFFLGNLHTVQGEVHEARAAVAEDDETAAAERRAALRAYDRANEIYLARQKELMGEVSP